MLLRHITKRQVLNIIFLTLVLLLLTPCLLNYVNPTRPALRCNGAAGEVIEPDFSHRHRRDTITTSFLLSVAFFAPLLQFLLVEYFDRRPIETAAVVAVWNSRPTTLFFRVSSLYIHYFIGFVFTVAVNEIGKSTLNYPRPHFLDTCKPTFPSSACVSGWVEEYECSNAVNVTRWRLVDSHKSFPSGHAAIGMYTAIFMICYQHAAHGFMVMMNAGHFVVLYAVHGAWLTWGLFCGYSRIMDYRHHAADVGFGNLVGVAGACYAVYMMRKQQNAEYGQVGAAGGGCGGTSSSSSNGDLKRQGPPGSQGPLHRKLSAQQSTMTQMSDISEDGELYQV